MKRFLIFALLGPLLGFLTFAVLVLVLNHAVDGSIKPQPGFIVLLPLAYALGIVPALITALFDYALRAARYRILGTALFAYFAGLMPVLSALLMGFINSPYVFVVGLVGLVPGAMCSWLSGKPA